MTGTVVSGGRVGLLLLAGLCALTFELRAGQAQAYDAYDKGS